MESATFPPSLRRIALRVLASLGVTLLLVIAFFVAAGWEAFGARARGERLERMKRSKQWAGSGFENPQPLWNDLWGSLVAFNEASADVAPRTEVPVVRGGEERFASAPESGLRITWFGHSTTLIELDGVRVLTDPAFSERASPYQFLGPQRWYPPLIPLEKLPKLDAVVISHDHYDHLDMGSVKALRGHRFFVPLGLGAHLEYWGIPAGDITELDWWEEGRVKGVRVVSTPARHASGRQVLDQGAKLWGSWSLIGPQHRVYYSGDTGLFPALKEVGEKLGPFDVAMVEVGQYHRAWPDWHIGPEQAVRAAGMVQAKLFFPIHWGLFTLAMHGWTEPIERALAEAQAKGMPIVTPMPGESVDPAAPAPPKPWWPAVPWQRASEHPIVSTKVD
jgi:L-ascorbate metabolism protein UlaG (beta-lactamase superfamily)